MVSSYSRHCDSCLQRRVTFTDPEGHSEERIQYYQRAVGCPIISSPVKPFLAWEWLQPGEGEDPTALRLLRRLPELYGSRFFDILLLGSLYAHKPALPLAQWNSLGCPPTATPSFSLKTAGSVRNSPRIARNSSKTALRISSALHLPPKQRNPRDLPGLPARCAKFLLPRRDGQIVVLYHWRGATMREIGRLFNLNERRVSQIHKRALERMAAALQSLGITSSSSILWRQKGIQAATGGSPSSTASKPAC